MQHSFTALGFQEASDSSMWIIIGVVLVLLFFVFVIAVVGLIIFFVMRKRSKAQKASAAAAVAMPGQSTPEPSSAYQQEALAGAPEVAVALDTPPPAYEPVEEIRSDYAEAVQDPASLDFDPSRTVAITRENTVTISYGFIKFVSGALSGQQFDVNPEGSYIGRESSLSQIVVPDPRISKRHMWIGVRDGLVRIVDQESRNGTFLNDPKSERITEATLTSGDTVILGESDVARFEYHA
jgi:hypothetical protein